MLISNHCLYVHIPKTGGTSVRQVVFDHSQACMISVMTEAPGGPLRGGKYSPHQMMSQIRRHLNLDCLWKFTIIRNPWDRFVSWYANTDKSVKFPVFLDKLLTDGSGRILQSNYFRPDLTYNYVARLETIEDDWKVISPRLGITAQLPRENRASHLDYHHYYQDCPHLIDKIYELEKPFLEQFNYGY